MSMCVCACDGRGGVDESEELPGWDLRLEAILGVPPGALLQSLLQFSSTAKTWQIISFLLGDVL